jgi:hypothetical protein
MSHQSVEGEGARPRHTMALLGLSLRSLPLGTAYAVWTGIGTIGTAALGIAFSREPATALRLASIGLIVGGIVGLKVARREALASSATTFLQGSIENRCVTRTLRAGACRTPARAPVSFTLQHLDLVENSVDTLSECCQVILHMKRALGIVLLLQQSVSHELAQALIQHFRGQSWHAPLQRARPNHALSNPSEDVQCPLATDDVLDDRSHGLSASVERHRLLRC